MSTTTGDMAGAPRLFTRKATGLVREGKTRDALFYNVMWSSVALTFAFYWLFIGFYPGSNALLGVAFAAILGVPGAFLYAMLTQVMPRTGGDYVFNSRALHPSIGFAANFSYCGWLALVFGLYSTYIASYGFGAFGRTMAGFTGSHGWLEFGEWFSTHWGLFITGSVVLLLSAALFAVGGTRLFFKIQVGAFALYVIGALLMPALVGLFQSHSGFIANFNSYAANLGTPHAYGKLVGSAQKAGFAPTKFSLEYSLRSVSVFWFIFGYIYASTYFAGEIRLQKRVHMKSMPGALLLVVVALFVMIPTFTHAASYTFNGMLGVAEPAAYGFASGAPAYPEIMGIASGSAVLGVIMIVGFTAGLLIWLPQTMILISRSMFAWSFDRIMPDKLSAIEPRSRSPLLAIAIVLVLAIGSTAIYAFTTWFSTLAILLGLTFTLLVTSISGMVLPFTQKAMVDASPYARKVMGIPLFTLVGGFSFLGFATAIFILLWDEGSGASLSKDPGKIELTGIVYAAGFAIYFIARAIRRTQGIDLSLAHRELPPE
ncbi:MAG TPA: amino acid permease [Solirubrobacteraceae bacterium]|nr:amino acid permease [Solirubrobacteraceae bacterium]